MAFFEVKEKGKEKYLDIIPEVERKLMNIQGFNPSVDLSIAWRAMRLEGIKTKTKLKRDGWWLTKNCRRMLHPLRVERMSL